MISTAAGLASCGKIVFVNSFAVFLTGRAFDQIRQQISLPKPTSSSAVPAPASPWARTGHAPVDQRRDPDALPAQHDGDRPADGNQTEQAVVAAYRLPGPVYLRLSRYHLANSCPRIARSRWGRAAVLREGERVALVATGPVTAHALEAAGPPAGRRGQHGSVQLPHPQALRPRLRPGNRRPLRNRVQHRGSTASSGPGQRPGGNHL